MYEEKKRMENEAFSYGHLDDIEDLFSADNTALSQSMIQNPQLARALDELRIRNECWYEAVMDYYLRYEETTYDMIAAKYGVSKVEAYRRVTHGVAFLIEIMAAQEQ